MLLASSVSKDYDFAPRIASEMISTPAVLLASLVSEDYDSLWSNMSRVQAWAIATEILVCPITRIPLSALLAESNGKAEPIQLVPAQLQELPEDLTVKHEFPFIDLTRNASIMRLRDLCSNRFRCI